MSEQKEMFPPSSGEITRAKQKLAPEIYESWKNFSRTVFQAGALDEKTKQLIAVAVAHVTQCPYCIKGHVPQAMKKGATKEEIMEAIWVASEMRSGGAWAHANIAVEAMREAEEKQ